MLGTYTYNEIFKKTVIEFDKNRINIIRPTKI